MWIVYFVNVVLRRSRVVRNIEKYKPADNGEYAVVLMYNKDEDEKQRIHVNLLMQQKLFDLFTIHW